MRVSLGWLRELVELPDEPARATGERLVRVGLELETVERVGDVHGPLVVGEVIGFDEELASNGKSIRWCQVDVGEGEPRGIVCGAANFATGDRVVVALPGAVLPGGFEITARKTYGHVSDGMLCSVRELGLGDEHDGILVLDGSDAAPGADAAAALGLGDEVLDFAVTPDRGYCLSMRGIARETASAYGVSFRDPAQVELDPRGDGGWPVEVHDPQGCPAFVARAVSGIDPTAATPGWMQQRLRAAGMRPISLVVDVTNYVMLELGQPLHAYDRDRLSGAIVVRRALAGESVRTLDGNQRALDPEDLVITDGSGPIGVAGVMGGASTEVSDNTTAVVIEAAHFDAVAVARAARRHRLPSEASKRFERGVDPELPEVAAQRAVELLAAHGGGQAEPGTTLVDQRVPNQPIALDPAYVSQRSGLEVSPDDVQGGLTAVGCAVDLASASAWQVSPPSWRPDLADAVDLVEEVVRLVGYDAIPSRLPRAVPGRGLTPSQRRRRAVARALAAAGGVEVLSYPFIGPAELTALGIPADDPRWSAVRIANPISAEQPCYRTTLLPGLIAAATRNLGRGAAELSLFELGLVASATASAPAAPRPPVDRRPSAEDLAQLTSAIPEQRRRVGALLVGAEHRGWAQAMELARTVARAAGVELELRQGQLAPWHPGRCAELVADGTVVGHAGELHPRVAAALRLPGRPAALELDLDALPPASPVQAGAVSGYPVGVQDLAFIVAEDVPAADVERALRAGAGELLESVTLFDVYRGEQLRAGERSLAFTLRLRAPDRTLSADELAQVRDRAVAEAAQRTGAVLRS